MLLKQVIVTGQNEVILDQRELERHELAPGEVLIETERSFISAGTELANYTGASKTVFIPGSWNAYPWKSGYANIGTIIEAGEKYQSMLGQRVYSHTKHASYNYVTPNPQNVIMAPVPAGLPSEDAAATRMAMVALSALDVSTQKYGRWVAVFGLGMVGNLAAQIFQITGGTVIGIDPSEQRRKMAKECGIPHTIGGTDEEVIAQIKEITGGHLADVAIDAVGHSAIALQAVRATATGGEVIVLGSPRCEVQGNLTDIFEAAHYRWITIKGCLEWYLPADSAVAIEHSQTKKLEALYRWVGDGRLKVKPMITHILPPEEIKTAYEGLLRKKEEYVGVVLRWK